MTRPDRERELDEELRAHLDLATRDRIARGESADEAAAAARREFGNETLVREMTREMWGWRRVERALQDVRYGLRLLRRSPIFTVVAIGSLALGIGATSAVFSVLNAVGLRALPIARAHELVEITPVSLDGARGSFYHWRNSISNPIWEQLREQPGTFRGTLAYGVDTFNLATGGEYRPAAGLFVSGSYFDVLEIRAERGRLFTAADDRRGCPPRAVISHRFWQNELNADPAAIGSAFTLDSVPTEIVGVTPATFLGLEVGRTFDVAVLICSEPAFAEGGGRLDSGTDWWLIAMGRLAPGIGSEQADARMRQLSASIFRATLAANYPAVSVAKYLEMKLQVLPAATGISSLRETYERSLWVLLSLATLVLILTCANLTNLMLARGSAREGEMALRLGLGASRGRVVLQLLTESAILAVLGAASALALGQLLSAALVALVGGEDPDIVLHVGIDWGVVGFTTLLGSLTCLLVGLLPALNATKLGPAAILKGVGRALTLRREGVWVRRGLAVAQVAISMVLLFGAAVFTRTLLNLASVDTGFDRSGVLMTAADLRRTALPANRRNAFKQAAVERVRQLPGVEAAATTSFVPLGGSSQGNDITFDTSAGPRTVNMLAARVSNGYFDTFRIRLLAGRDFDPSLDTPATPRVVIVNQTLAAMFDGGRAVGRRFRREATSREPVTEFEIIGVVADSKYLSLRQEPYPVVFSALSQDPQPSLGLMIAVRSRVETAAITPAIVQSFRELDPTIGVSFRLLETVVERTFVRERLMARLSLFFGSIAAVLAVIGLYGLFAYTVARRTNEIGIRIALGASRQQIRRLILGQAGRLVAAGLSIGTALSIAGSRFAETLVFGVAPRDPLSIGAAAALLGAIALLASYLPARRASRIKPVTALRIE